MVLDLTPIKILNQIRGFMKSLPKIQSSTDYDCFQLYKSNRKIISSHVDKLASDPSFFNKFPTCPIIVDKEFNIVDGQHRFFAAKKIQSPIYYIMDFDATEDDVRKRNTQMKSWKGIDYIHYFSECNESFRFLLEMKERHEVSLSFLNAVLLKLANTRQLELNYQLKEGKLKLDKYKNDISEFLDLYVPAIKRCRAIKGQKETTPLFLQSYIIAFAHFFKNDKKVFMKALDKISKTNLEFPYTTQYEKTRNIIEKISRWTPKTFKE